MARGLPALVLACGLLLLPWPAWCAPSPPLVLEDQAARYVLGPHVDLLEDPEGLWSVEDVSGLELSPRFRPVGQTSINLGVTSSVWWLRFRLAQGQELQMEPGQEWILDCGWPHHYSVRLFLPLPGGGFAEERAGDPSTLHPGEPPRSGLTFLLPRSLGAPADYYLRVRSHAALFLPLEVLSEESLLEKQVARTLGQGIYFGVMLAMLGLNLLLFLTLRDRSHVWYLLYVACITLYFLAYNGFLLRGVFGGRGDLEFTACLLVMGSFIVCAAQFSRSFLLTRDIAPEADRVLRLVILATLAAMAVTPGLPHRYMIHYYVAFAFVAPAITVWCGALSLRRGFRPARFYLVAWSVMTAGGVVHALLFLRALPLNDLTRSFFQASTAVEAVILALGLANRVRLLRLEREKLLATEERLRAVLDATPFPLVLSSLPDGTVLFANQAASQALRLPREALLGSSGHAYYADPSRRAEIFAQLRSQGRVQNLEAEMGLPGVWGRIASVSATLMDYQGQSAALIVIQDITDRRRVEDALRRGEERYRLLVENTNEGVGVMQDDIVRYANKRLLAISGYPQEQVLGRDTYQFVHPGDRGLAREMAVRILSGALASADLSLRIFNRDARLRWLDLHMVRIDWEGRPAVLYFASDVTQRRVMEQDLLTAKAQAEEASQAKSAFLASMSHEIRTPLSAVIGMVDLVLAGELAPPQRDCLGTAADSARHLLTIINDLLDFSKIEAGKLVLERLHFDLREVVDSAARTFLLQARQQGLALEVQIESEVPRHVIGDPSRLRQVLVNLLSNALKFTAQGGVTLRVQAVDPGRPGLLGARFLVTDTGIGIAPEKTAEIFESFTQAEGSISRRYGGTGLGLAISRRLVELMGGGLAVDSEPDRGSTFFFSLAFEPGDPRLTSSQTRAPRPGDETGRALRLLLVEDNPVNVKVAQMHLSQLGHSVVACLDGREALSLLARERFDVVLMDLEMPGMDGLEVTRRIRAGGKEFGAVLDPLAPIVAMTAHAVTEIRDRCLAAGMDGYVVKPVNFPDLAELLQRLARGEREAGRLHAPLADPLAFRDPASLPVLDKAGAMRLMGIDAATFEAVLEHSLQEMDRRLHLARQALEARDQAGLSLHAHTLEGTAAGMGAPRCAHFALRLHEAATAGNSESVLRNLDILAAEFQQVLAQVAQERS